MTYVPTAGASAATAAAAIAQAIKASGVLVQVEENDFLMLLSKTDRPLVIISETKIFKTSYQYMMSYKGFAFYVKAARPIQLPGNADVIAAKKIWIPA